MTGHANPWRTPSATLDDASGEVERKENRADIKTSLDRILVDHH